MNNLAPAGGSLTFAQKVKDFLTLRNIIIFIGLSLCLSLLGYFIYKQYINANTSFKANRENVPKDQLSNKTATLMLFYVDWCPHCKTAKPEWDQIKEQYQGREINGYTIIITEHNCTEESAGNDELLNKYKIEGYPTIKLLKDNQVIEFDAKPSKDNLEQFLNTAI